MEEASSAQKKGAPSLTIDRAAFLLLRVKKAFKKKRQQRKEKQAAQAAAALASQTCGGKSSRGRPAPLLRSRTLPAIIVPGISILHTQIDPNRLHTEGFANSGFAARLSLQPRTSPRISLTSDDTSLDYRRRSAGSPYNFPTTSTTSNSAINSAEPYIYAFDDLERHPDGTVVLRIPAPHVVAARAYRMSGGSTSGPSGAPSTLGIPSTASSTTTSSQGGTALYKLARLLNQSKTTSSPVLKDDAPRRLSWERRDQNNRLPRSASIDSMVEAVWSESPRPSLTPSAPMPIVTIAQVQPSPQLLQVNYAETPSRRESLLSPSTGRRSSKAYRGITALFSAVEHGHLEKARTILESTDVDVNSVNSDGLAPLDVAVLSNNRSMTKMLLQHGAIDRAQFKGGNTLGNHLNSLLRDAENRIQELGSAEEIPQTPYSTRASFSSIIGNAYTGPSVTGCTGTETDKQIGLWERRVKGLRRMLLGWDQARPPDPPNTVLVDVVGPSSVAIRIYEPIEGPLGTKFKVQWSSRADFSNIVGECDIAEWNSFQGTMGATCRIGDLTQGRRYFFRACLGNVKGFGHYRTSSPSSVVPSSWYDVEQRENRFVGRQRVLDELFAAVRLARPEDASNIPLETPALQRRNPKKKTTIKQLFSAASKFQKNLRRGIYLACILYHEDKVLVTNEDFIPVIEIDETYPGCLHTDYHWLMKVACTWDDVKSLRTDMERNATSAVHFRTKLLTAACQMQSALCITDLGQLFHKPLRDSHGTVVLSCVNFIKSPKTISVLNSRWIPLNKVHKKLSALHEDNNINEILMNSIQEQINYHQASAVRLTKGLYLGYLKMQSSVDQIQVVVPSKTPNVLPHCKIRDNPHISAEEWEFLKGRKSTIMFGPQSEQPTEVQQLFLEDLTIAAHRLFKYMDTPTDDALKHRLYDVEVIELSPDVSFLAICPPPEFSCAVPGQREILLQRGDLLSLPLQAFEMIHLRTYQNSIIQKYSRLSCILELDTVLANHSHREAFSTVEVQAAKERLCKLQELSANLNVVWKGVRWLMDVISFARDRTCTPALGMRDILECQEVRESQVDETKRQLLQPPPRDAKLMKSSPGRGSWPGPAVSSGNGLLVAEHSKSEQHLCVAGSSNMSSRYLSATSEFDASSRKNSADSNYSHSGHSYYSVGCEGSHVGSRLPPSRSEDTLNVSKKQPHRKRTTTVNTSFSAASSPLLNIRSTYTGTTESVHSLSSDSESASYTVLTSTPNKSRPQDEEAPVGVVRSRKQLFETLHITEDAQEQPFFPAPGPSGTATRSENRRQAVEPTPSNSHTHEVPARESSAQEEAEGVKESGIIQVYAAYETGLASGTSLKLHVTTKTTAREVVDLVVKQLNMAVVLKGREGPIYTADKLENFCLVAVIGARERCLRDDFKPLQLQNPWKKGRLYVRQKQDLLAAIEHSNREAQMI